MKFTESGFRTGKPRRGEFSAGSRPHGQQVRGPDSEAPLKPNSLHPRACVCSLRGPGDAAPAFPPRPWPRTPCDRLRSSALPKPPSAGSPNEPEARNPTTSSAAHCPQPLSIVRQRERLSFLRHFSSEPLVSGHVPGRPVVPRGGPPPPPVRPTPECPKRLDLRLLARKSPAAVTQTPVCVGGSQFLPLAPASPRSRGQSPASHMASWLAILMGINSWSCLPFPSLSHPDLPHARKGSLSPSGSKPESSQTPHFPLSYSQSLNESC